MARFCSLFSSSSGNCTYVGSSDKGILIDAGVSARSITLKLDCIGVSPADIGAIFVTHEHSDHVKGIRVFAKKNNIPVFATAGTIRELEKTDCLKEVNYSVIDENGIDFQEMHIDCFRTSHDVAQSCGYRITTSDDRKIAVATDTGIVTDEMKKSLSGCDLVLLESNHDIGMLRNGIYPYMLKRRILSDVGHLSNLACSEFVPELVENGTTRLFLGHLSKDNNIPELAYQTSRSALECAGATEYLDYILKIAGDENPEMVVF